MPKSLYKYKEATIPKPMLIIGIVMDIILVIMAFLVMSVPTLP